MNVAYKLTRHFAAVLGTCLLMLLVAACGGIGSSPSPTPSVPTATPTSAPSPTFASVSLQTYSSNPNFTIGYPQTWKASTSSPSGTTNLITFADPTGVYQLVVSLAPDPNGALPAAQVAQASLSIAESSLKLSNAQPVSSVPATATVAGQTWSQQAVTGTTTEAGQTVTAELIVLSYVANNQAYSIAYGTAQPLFNLAVTSYFQPMLQSFQFK